MPSKKAKKTNLKHESISTKFYVMCLSSAYFLADKQIPIKCYFIYYLNETTIYFLLLFLKNLLVLFYILIRYIITIVINAYYITIFIVVPEIGYNRWASLS